VVSVVGRRETLIDAVNAVVVDAIADLCRRRVKPLPHSKGLLIASITILLSTRVACSAVVPDGIITYVLEVGDVTLGLTVGSPITTIGRGVTALSPTDLLILEIGSRIVADLIPTPELRIYIIEYAIIIIPTAGLALINNTLITSSVSRPSSSAKRLD